MSDQPMVTRTIAQYEEFVNPALAKLFRIMGLSTLECRAKGVYIYDSAGEKYLDCLGGYGVFSLGHANDEIIDAVKEQLTYMPMSGKILLNDKMAQLSAKLAEILPGLKYSFIVNSGAEAVEGALKLARIHTGKSKIIAMHNAFHGKTLGALSATGRKLFREPFTPLVPGFCHIDFDDISALEEVIDEETAAVILEPIQGEGGIIVPKSGYISKVRALCDRYGALLICDEVQTGLGRTGRMFAVDYDGVVPDIMVLAKALGGGVMPIGAFCAKEEVWDKYRENPLLHTSTFGGNQLSCVAAITAINILLRDYEEFAVEEKGNLFLKGLKKIQDSHPRLIEAVRGRGLMLGIVLRNEGIGGFVMAECIKRHILIAYTLNNPRVIRLEPPFIITHAMIEDVLANLAEIFQLADSVFGEE